MVLLTCPQCATSTAVGDEHHALRCPCCGSALGEGCLAGPDREPTDEQFQVDLREAFAFSRFGLGHEASLSRSLLDLSDGKPTCGVDLTPGTRLGDFEIVSELGRGGMGIVYRALQVSLDRTVALKVLPPNLHRRGSSLRRFRTEAMAVARLKHPNIVPIYAQGEAEGYLYYAMELIDGVGLDVAIHCRPALLEAGPRCGRSANVTTTRDDDGPLAAPAGPGSNEDNNGPPEESPSPTRGPDDFRYIARLIAGAADGLAHACDEGVIHRDMKPHNLLLGVDGRLYITDFGLAHLTDEPHLTFGDEVMGTAAYLSPEQVHGDTAAIDHRTDVYSLGATLYESITQRRPFDGRTRDEIISNICTNEPVRPRRLDARIPRDLETICLRAMERAPSRRYQSAAIMADELRRFADHRPILSRRVGMFETALKWARRHRAATVAIVTAAIAVGLGIGLVHTVRSARHARADNLLRQAYEKLAFVDYQRPELVTEQLEDAATLGAEPVRLDLVWALAHLGMSENAAAIGELQRIVEGNPEDARPYYLLAWAYRRSGNFESSQDWYATAETRSGPRFADTWFYRGLAVHFDQPDVALLSYRQATAQRAREHEFYPQAVLHLARALNQQMYVNRTAEPFAEAEASLGLLIEHEHYGAYPYYLLSIAHRLAAEIEVWDAGESDDAVYHFDQALYWSRAGQLLDPDNERCVTAEAECLESLGQYEQAIDARTRAIERADKPLTQWEGHHYRWRLYYWTHQYDEALADLEVCTHFDPTSRFYAFVYPALVHAEIGDWETAIDLARNIATYEPGDATAILWSATTLRLLGQEEEASALLDDHVNTIDATASAVTSRSLSWIQKLYALCLGEEDLAELTTAAEKAESPRKRFGEAYFHAGAMALAQGRHQEAYDRFEAAYLTFDGEQAYTYHARIILKRVQDDADWPEWITSARGNGDRED